MSYENLAQISYQGTDGPGSWLVGEAGEVSAVPIGQILVAPSVIKIEVQQAPCQDGYSPPSISQFPRVGSATAMSIDPKLIW